MNSSTYTQFVASRRMGICEPIHQIGMWDDFNPSTSATMILEVEKCLDDQIPIMEKRLVNEVCLFLAPFLFSISHSCFSFMDKGKKKTFSVLVMQQIVLINIVIVSRQKVLSMEQ